MKLEEFDKIKGLYDESIMDLSKEEILADVEQYLKGIEQKYPNDLIFLVLQ